MDITPLRQHKISSMNSVVAQNQMHHGVSSRLYKPLMLSLPSNNDLKSLLAFLSSTRLANRYFIARVIQYSKYKYPYYESPMACMCDIAKPFVWYRHESAGSASEVRLGDELRGEMGGDQSDELI